MSNEPENPPRGFAMVSVAILLGITLAFGLILVDSATSNRRAERAVIDAYSALQIAEAGMRKAVFCLNQASGSNCGGSFGTLYAGESDVTFGSGTFTTIVTGSGTTRRITSTGGRASGRKATIIADATTIPKTDDPAFSYALQAGDGGAHFENNSQINGTIYTSGDIDCQTTQARITGDAYVSRTGGKIDKCRVDFHAHADKILNSTVKGDAYYKNNPADIQGTNVTGTKYADSATPAAVPLPDLDLDFWRDSAEAGGVINGTYAPADNSTLGPIKIAGDLVMNNNVDVTIAGPVWVVGNITTGNNNSFTLAPDFGAYGTVILADDPYDNASKGKITISNGTGVTGSADPSSHILFASTNSSSDDANPALSVANTSSGAVFYAVNGVMRLQNNASAKSLAGKRLFLDQQATISYVQSEFTGLFSNSPGSSWRLLENTWREKK